MPVALVTDSTAYLSAAETAAHGIGVVPLHVVIGGQEYQEGVDVTPQEVAAALREFTPVSTSRPAPQAFTDVYAAAVAAGATAIVSVHLSAELSSTLGSAQIAAEHADVPVTVVDSRVMGAAMAIAVTSGALAAGQGADGDEVAALVRARCAAATCIFYVDTLEAVRAVDDAPEGADVVVHHVDAPERAAKLATRLGERIGADGPVPIVELGAVVGAHVGPGTLAIAVVPRVSIA